MKTVWIVGRRGPLQVAFTIKVQGSDEEGPGSQIEGLPLGDGWLSSWECCCLGWNRAPRALYFPR